MSAPPLAPVAGRDGEREYPPIKRRIALLAHAALDPVARGLARIGVRADHVTVIGLVLSLGAALAFFEGWFRQGAVLAALAGLCDVLDGEVARRGGVRSKFGAFLDSTLDRLSEGMVLTGLAGFYIINLVDLALDPSLVAEQVARGLEPRTWAAVALIAVVALVGSFVVSYTRARAEGLGLDCKVGLVQRAERILLIGIPSLFVGAGPDGLVLQAIVGLLALGSTITVVQRFLYVRRITDNGAN